MPNIEPSSSLRSRLQMQGYRLDDRAVRDMDAPLRLTPAFCAALAAAGLLLASPLLFAVLAVLGGVGAAFRGGNVIDRAYNVFRREGSGPVIPPAPAPRRFSCGIAAVFSVLATVGFLLEVTWVGYLFGTFVLLGSGLAASSHWCLGGWIYGRVCGRPACEPT